MNYIAPLIVALVIGSTKDIFKKKILLGIKPIQFIVIFYGTMFLLAQLTLTRIRIPRFDEWVIISMASICYVLANILGLKILKEVKISIVKPIAGLESVLVVFLSVFLLGEILSRMQLFGVLIIVFSMIYMVLKQYKKHALSKKQVFIIFVSLIAASMITIFDRIALRTMDPLSYFYFLKLVLFIIFGIILMMSQKDKLSGSTFKKYTLSIGLLAGFTMIGTYAYFFALKDSSASTGVVKTVLSTSIIFSTFLGGGYFHEKNLKEQVFIAMLSCAGVIILIST